MTQSLMSAYKGVTAQLAGKYLVGNEAHLRLILIAYLSGGHVLIEGPPGTGKTKAGRLLAEILARSFKRIQFTSDLLPADIIGAHLYSQKSESFRFVNGPIFADFVLADEINRAPPRTQSALLEAMEERQVTSEGERFPLSPNFFVLATQNPQELEGTFPLPEAQIDRFMMKLVVGHGDAAAEQAILARALTGELEPKKHQLVAAPVDLDQIATAARTVSCDASLLRYISDILAATRSHPLLTWGSSIRGGIALMTTARIAAALAERSFVTPDDIKLLALPVLRHRLRLTPDAEANGTTDAQVVADIIQRTKFPV